MKVLIGSTYYVPHISGFTLYTQTLAEGLAQKGIEVTVLTYQHESSLKKKEVINNVKIIRVSPLVKASRGVFSPIYFYKAIRLASTHDLIHLHHPMLELAGFALVAKLLHKPVIVTYHCDLHLPAGFINFWAEKLTNLSFLLGAHLADKIAVYSKDFADHSTFLPKYQEKIRRIYPPIHKMSAPSDLEIEKLKQNYNLKEENLIGYAGRVSEEKGADILIKAISYLEKALDDFKVVFAGEYEDVKGENFYGQIKPLIEKHKEKLVFLGQLKPEAMSSFYKLIDVLVVPSRRETFAMVQVEAMLHGAPVVVSDVYGGRVPIQKTGMGEIAKIADSKDLAAKIIQVLKNKQDYIKPPQEIQNIFDSERSIQQYLELYEKALHS